MSISKEDLADQILNHKRKYYSGEPEITDAEYDLLENLLREIDPDNPVLFLVGTPDGGKVPHDPPMLSSDKAVNIKVVMKFVEKIENRSVYAGFKVDGLSLSLIYNNGKLIQAATRGNGLFGDDVTLAIMNIQNIPKEIPSEDNINIRGELYMKISDFLEINKGLLKDQQYTSPRNLAAGTIKQKNVLKVRERELNFKAFDLVGIFEELSIDEITKLLKSWNFDVADIILIEEPNENKIEAVYQDFEKERDELDFEIDGVIFKYNNFKDRAEAGYTEHHPKWQIAWKFPNKQTTTKIKQITWQVGRTGVLTPVAEVETVEIAGANISRATLHNVDFIQNLEISVGDEIAIERAGDVIPKIIDIVEKGENQLELPERCPSCNTKLIREGVNLLCQGDACRDRDIQRIIHWIKMVEIDGLGIKNVEKLYDLNLVHHFGDLYSNKLDQNTLVSHLGKNGEKIIKSIKVSKNVHFSKFLAGLGIQMLGKKMGKVLSKEFKSFNELQQTSITNLVNIEGISDLTASYLINGINDPRYTEKLFENGVTIIYTEKAKERGKKAQTSGLGAFWDDFAEDENKFEKESLNIGQGKKIYITGSISGFSKNELQDLIEELGFQWSSSITRKLDLLVFGEKAGQKKLEKAKELEVKIYSWNEFHELYGLD